MITSQIAREKYAREGKQERDWQIILRCLSGRELTAWGISRIACYEVVVKNKKIRKWLSYTAVSRRMKQLRDQGKIEMTGVITDEDGSKRMAYRLYETSMS